MADKRVGGIFASSFIAGVLLAAAIVSPRAWEPVPGPYFGLDDGARPAAGGPVQLGDGIEAAHAELSLRARTTVATTQPAPAASPADKPTPGATASPFPESSRQSLFAQLDRADATRVVESPRQSASEATSPPSGGHVPAAAPLAGVATQSAPIAWAPVTPEEPQPQPAVVGESVSVGPFAQSGARDETAPDNAAAIASAAANASAAAVATPPTRAIDASIAAPPSPNAMPAITPPVVALPTPVGAPLPFVVTAAPPVSPPERVAIADVGSVAGARALASALPAAPAPAGSTVVRMPIATGAAAAPFAGGGGVPGGGATEPTESLKALVNRVQSSQNGPAPGTTPVSPPLPRLAMAPQARPLPATVDVPPSAMPPSAMSPSAMSPSAMPAAAMPPAQREPRQLPPGPTAWVARQPGASEPHAAPVGAAPGPRASGSFSTTPTAGEMPPRAGQVVSLPPSGGGSLGAAPLPGEPWTDPDGVNWSDAIAAVPSLEPDRRRTWLGERITDPRAAQAGRGSRILDRLRGGDRRVASLPEASATGPLLAETAPAGQGGWPRPVRLEQQLDQLAKTALAHDDRAGGEPIAAWANQTRGSLRDVSQTSGPRDGSADACLMTLGETVIAGMSLADTTGDAGLASLTRRAALAVARRVAVWRAGTALFATLKQPAAPLGESDAAAAMTRQFHGRAVEELGRLLEGIERFELACTPADARTVKGALESICGFYPTAARPLGRAVEDHYLAPNVRIAVHQKLLDSLLPAATVDTAPFTDFVAGHEVRGTRTVERKTTVRLVPDDDEILLHLEVQGDIASRSTTDAGAVSVTARSASAFVVQKPISIGSRGLLFGNAAGVASNRSKLDTIQTSFDGVPVMGQLVRNIARNQHAETMPTVNREVIDKIIARACREVDTQSEPEFTRMAERVREQAWLPLERLGLEPKAVALQTTTTTATMRLRLAADSQLAAHTPRPRAPADALLSVQMHESTANNALERLGLAGRRFTLEDLIRTVCTQIGSEPRLPEDLPEGVTVAFAESQPLRIECRDGLVHVRVALDAIESGRRDWYDLVAHVAYRPVCRGPQVFLERDGPIQLAGPGTGGRLELALRTIFGKIFPKERPVPVLPEKIVANPRLTSMQATQAVSSDGWLAITLEEGAAPSVAQPAPAPAARPADARRKSLFR